MPLVIVQIWNDTRGFSYFKIIIRHGIIRTNMITSTILCILKVYTLWGANVMESPLLNRHCLIWQFFTNASDTIYYTFNVILKNRLRLHRWSYGAPNRGIILQLCVECPSRWLYEHTSNNGDRIIRDTKFTLREYLLFIFIYWPENCKMENISYG